ncbi:MAG: rhamnulokinase [Verrucomicrobiales bacterium]|nr:rhamnulokinase [Verrucomicrobiales bacterium]MCP5528263.1 rhamnulokinase [Verrucomicrobiales bacterium]
MLTRYLACDLGAESGRLILGTLEDDRLSLTELHRFTNGALRHGESLHWDLDRLLGELRTGLRKAGDLRVPIASISADSWGVDYVLRDDQGNMLPPVHHYRDPRNQGGVDKVRARISWEEIFAETGLQFLPFNTLFQLGAERPERLQAARQVLGIGDAFNAWLCGVAKWEESLASTTQLYDPRARRWSPRLLEVLGLKPAMFPEVVPSGTALGALRPDLAESARLDNVSVVASCSHDTGAAVAAVPAEGDNWAYLSSGTWSLMGVELPEPVITDDCRELNFTNEIGYGHSVRLLKNIIGLWIVQECRREWAQVGNDYDYQTLTNLAAEAAPFVSLINPADARFLSPGNMPAKVEAACRETGQPTPETPGAMVRCVLESLALLYRRTMEHLRQLTGRKPERLHIVGGGSQNALLNQFAANALQVPVLAGPVEATAAGNVLVQALALGHLESLTHARQVVRRSFELVTIEPEAPGPWDEAHDRFEELLHSRP